jgi:septal ring factor EnvC (AmiA/AmiB activator)
MSERAQVTSLEALESFRTSLVLFLSKTRPALEDVGDEVRRTRGWLNDDRLNHWRNEVRRQSRALEEAQQALFSARLSSLQQPTTAHQWAVTRAQRALREAEDKLRLIKKWNREFDNLTEPLTKQLDQAHTFLASDMRQAAAYLARLTTTLEAYADRPPGGPATGPLTPDSPSEAGAAIEVQNARAAMPTGMAEPKDPKETPP